MVTQYPRPSSVRAITNPSPDDPPLTIAVEFPVLGLFELGIGGAFSIAVETAYCFWLAAAGSLSIRSAIGYIVGLRPAMASVFAF
jgi:hypothetical protein